MNRSRTAVLVAAVLAAIVMLGGVGQAVLGRPAHAATMAFNPCASTGEGSLRFSTGNAQHLVFAISPDYSSNEVVVTECVRNGGSWETVSTTTGRAGQNGFAEAGAKHEGDGKSPTGSYLLSEAFGVVDPGTGLPYRELRDTGDCWGATPGQSHYNEYYSGACRATDENLSVIMRSGSYRQAVVIDHNRPGAVDGYGSAIFFHVGGEGPTAGCIAIPEPRLRTIMRTLVEGDRMIMGPRAALFGP